MSSTQNQQLMENARLFTDQLTTTVRSDVATKLSKIDEACRSIIKTGGLVSMPSVRAYLSTNYGITIAPQTLSNKTLDKRTGQKTHSPLRQVIDKYAEVQRLSEKRPGRVEPRVSMGNALLSEADLASINDHQVRYKTQLLVGRVRNLSNQLNEVRAIQNLPSISAAAFPQSFLSEGLNASPSIASEGNVALDEEEMEAIKDFVKKTSMRRRNLDFDEMGTLSVNLRPTQESKTVALSKPELRSALEKIIQLYGRN